MTLTRFLTNLLPKELGLRGTILTPEATDLPYASALFDFMKTVATAQEIEAIGPEVCVRLADLLGGDCVRLVGWEDETDRLYLLAEYYRPTASGEQAGCFDPAVERPVVSQALHKREVLTLYRRDTLTIMKGAQKTLLDSGAWQAGLLAPLLAGETVLGYLALYSRSRLQRFSRAEVAFCEAITAQAATVWQRQRLAGQLAAERETVLRVASKLVAAQEGERRRLSRELHDELGQALTALKINLDVARRALADNSAPVLARSLAEARSLSVHVLETARDLSHELRPMLLDDLGLVAAIRWQLDRHEQRTGQQTRFESHLDGLALPSTLEITLYRIIQEALTNVTRHAAAQTVWVALRRVGDELVLTVRDDGVGFDPATGDGCTRTQDGMGLAGMQERAALLHGQLSIQSRPGQGTRVEARFPLDGSHLPA